jgi:hypothetical protein
MKLADGGTCKKSRLLRQKKRLAERHIYDTEQSGHPGTQVAVLLGRI